ncbi:MAG: hypothetical protein OEM39_04480 [Acidimicrobiia bacterium]|nr:hypothetical protein [Acidimicrobiia bacterium]
MKRVATFAVIGLSLVGAACGVGDTDVSSRPRSTAPITTTNPPPLDETELELAEELWHSGFHVELTKAEVWTSTIFLTNRTQYWLTLWGDFENQGDEAAWFDSEMAIVAAGVSYTHKRDDPPGILPESPALGKLTFLIPEDLDLQSAEFVIGATDESQVRIPLGSQGAAVRLEPIDVEVSGHLKTELVDFEFTGATLRYDLPNLHRQLEKGKMALTVYFDITSRSPSDGSITSDDIALILPDGSVLAPSVADLGPLPGRDDGVTTADRTVSFVVDEMPSGDFTLRLVLGDPFVAEDGIVEVTFDFSL